MIKYYVKTNFILWKWHICSYNTAYISAFKTECLLTHMYVLSIKLERIPNTQLKSSFADCVVDLSSFPAGCTVRNWLHSTDMSGKLFWLSPRIYPTIKTRSLGILQHQWFTTVTDVSETLVWPQTHQKLTDGSTPQGICPEQHLPGTLTIVMQLDVFGLLTTITVFKQPLEHFIWLCKYCSWLDNTDCPVYQQLLMKGGGQRGLSLVSAFSDWNLFESENL